MKIYFKRHLYLFRILAYLHTAKRATYRLLVYRFYVIESLLSDQPEYNSLLEIIIRRLVELIRASAKYFATNYISFIETINIYFKAICSLSDCLSITQSFLVLDFSRQRSTRDINAPNACI